MKQIDTRIERVAAFRLDPGQDVLVALRKAIEKSGIQNGVIVAGIGSATRYRVHVVETTNLPPGDVFFEEEGPYDILAMQGLVIDGRVHAHITLSNTEKALGGHLEEGCRVLTFCIVTIAVTPGASFAGWDSI